MLVLVVKFLQVPHEVVLAFPNGLNSETGTPPCLVLVNSTPSHMIVLDLKSNSSRAVNSGLPKKTVNSAAQPNQDPGNCILLLFSVAFHTLAHVLREQYPIPVYIRSSAHVFWHSFFAVSNNASQASPMASSLPSSSAQHEAMSLSSSSTPHGCKNETA